MAKAVKKTIAKKSVAKKVSKKAVKKSAKKKSAKKKKEDLNCFLTSACVNFYGLKDTGYELNTLRTYRDSYLSITAEGKELIQTYYKISPPLVALINKDKNKASSYQYIYSQVQEACLAIEKKRFEKAKTIYKGMVNSLIEKYSK